ncbi:MAG: hypothetical protein ACLR0U_22125 [Enterocloster clostridioformis]
MVTFHYNKHEDNSFVQKTLPAIDFIKLLILHIPEKNFKNDPVLWTLCPDTGRLTISSIKQSQNPNTGFSSISTPGVSFSFLPWGTTPCNAQTADMKWSF